MTGVVDGARAGSGKQGEKMTYWDHQDEVRTMMQGTGIDGWLLMDFRGSNPMFSRVLGRGGIGGHVTRRTFVWLPADPALRPVVVSQAREAKAMADARWDLRTYRDAQELRDVLATLGPSNRLAGANVAMEYSPECALPYISRIDAGTVDLLTKLGANVVTSADLLQLTLARLSDLQIQQHREAAILVDTVKNESFQLVAKRVHANEPIAEYEVQQFIVRRFGECGLVTDAHPTVACGPNSATGHYTPLPTSSRMIGANDWLLIDLWARLDCAGSPYADVTWVAWTGPDDIPAKNRSIFAIVKSARDHAVKRIADATTQGRTLCGWEVDRGVRDLIGMTGFGNEFPHRTGHNLGPEEVHGSAGVCLDDFETHDTRMIMPGVAFSVEPGIYLEGEFGVRLEINVVMTEAGPVVHTPTQDEIIRL